MSKLNIDLFKRSLSFQTSTNFQLQPHRYNGFSSPNSHPWISTERTAVISIFSANDRNFSCLISHLSHLKNWIQQKTKNTTYIGAQEKIWEREGRSKISRKILLLKNMLMIRSTINILPHFACFIICLKYKKNYHYSFEKWHFCVKRLVLISVQLIKGGLSGQMTWQFLNAFF